MGICPDRGARNCRRRIGRRLIGLADRGPLPERGHHVDRPRMLAPATAAGGHHQQHKGNRCRGSNAGDRRQVGPAAEPTARQNGDNRRGQWQQRNQDEQKGRGHAGAMEEKRRPIRVPAGGRRRHRRRARHRPASAGERPAGGRRWQESRDQPNGPGSIHAATARRPSRAGRCG